LIETVRKLEERIERFRLQKEAMKTSYTAAAAEVKAAQAITGVGSSFDDIGETLRRAEDNVARRSNPASSLETHQNLEIKGEMLSPRRCFNEAPQ
jgi:phage shock protein A